MGHLAQLVRKGEKTAILTLPAGSRDRAGRYKSGGGPEYTVTVLFVPIRAVTQSAAYVAGATDSELSELKIEASVLGAAGLDQADVEIGTLVAISDETFEVVQREFWERMQKLRLFVKKVTR